MGDFQRARRQWVEQALEGSQTLRDNGWSESIAVGSLPFVETVKNDLGIKAMHREALETDGTYALREPAEAYAGKFTGKTEVLRIAAGGDCLEDIERLRLDAGLKLLLGDMRSAEALRFFLNGFTMRSCWRQGPEKEPL